MSFTALESKIYASLFSDEEAARIFSDEHLVQLWCAVEVALAQAEAAAGVIPADVARVIERSVRPENVDLDRLRAGTEIVGYPILPLVRLLKEMVGPEAGELIHWGATTQDIMDTAVALQVQELHQVVDRWLLRLADDVAQATHAYRHVLMAGRTHGQQAVPITLGLKFAVWLDELARHRERWRELGERVGYGQLSGAAGTLAALGADGPKVRAGMCQRLSLKTPPIAWHTARDVLGEVVGTIGLIAGTLGKMAGEVATLQRNEIGELSEGFEPGRGSSSTMPQKRNPITCEVMVAQAAVLRQQVPLLTYAMTGLHERATGEWQVEWIVLPVSGVLAVSLLRNACTLMEHLVVDQEAMSRNLDLTRGLIVAERVMMALAPFVGRQTAHDLVYDASAKAIDEGRALLETLLEDANVTAHVSREELRELLRPEGYVGSTEAFIEEVLQEWQMRRAAPSDAS